MIANGAACLHVRDAGVGPALVLLPGLGRDAADLDPLAGLLRAGGWRVLQPDPRGLGGSTGPLEELTLHDLASDIAAVIAAMAGEALIVGQGFGNRIARAVAARHKALVRAVVLLGCSGAVQPSPAVAAAIRLAQAEDTPPEIRARAVGEAWFAPGSDISVWLHGWSQPVIKAYLAAAAATDIRDWWTAGSAPVLIMQGAEDVSAPAENGHLLKAEIGDRATLYDLPGVGHAIGVEAPERVAELIGRYLRDVRLA